MVTRKKSQLSGRWRITSMEMWDQDFVDAEVPGFIHFAKDGLGEFHFGYVRCHIDWQEDEQDGQPSAEFSFEGMDEMEPTSGRGWAVLEDTQLNGKLCFHRGDESEFTASKAKR